MRITDEQAAILLRATEGHFNPRRTLDLSFPNNELLDVPGNQWAFNLLNKAKELSKAKERTA